MPIFYTTCSTLPIHGTPLLFNPSHFPRRSLLYVASQSSAVLRISSSSKGKLLTYRCARKLTPSARLSSRVLVGAAEFVVPDEQVSSTTRLKEFLEELKSVGRVRIIVNTGVGVLESVTSLEKLFYHTLSGRGEFANLMNKGDNVDFHLLIDKVKAAKLAKGKSMRGDIPTYTIRFIDDDGKTAASFLVMWKPDTDGEYDPGQVEAFEQLMRKYGEDLNFLR